MIIFTLAFGVESYSHNQCLDLFNNKIKVIDKNQEYSFASQSEYLVFVKNRVVESLQQWGKLLVAFSVPSYSLSLNMTLAIHSKYDLFENKMILGARLADHQFSNFETILAHEFGHLIFSEHFRFQHQNIDVLLKDLISAAKAEKEILKSDATFVELNKDIVRINEKLSSLQKKNEMTPEVEQLTSELNQKVKIWLETSPEMSNSKYLTESLLPYNELFADIFAAIVFRDQQVMSKAIEVFLDNPPRATSYSQAHGRSQTSKVKPREFGIIDFSETIHSQKLQYTLLDPARGVLWALFIKKLSSEEVPLFIKVYLLAVNEHLSQRLARGENTSELLPEISIKLLNQEFIKIFLAKAKENKLSVRK